MSQRKLYAYVDETGIGEGYLLVAVVLVDADLRAEVEDRLLQLEVTAGRHRKKWSDSSKPARTMFLRGLRPVVGGCLLCWARWDTAQSIDERRAEAIIRAVQATGSEVRVRPIIDGLQKAHLGTVRQALKTSGVQRFGSIPIGPRDEAYPALRLADATAGFLRHALIKGTDYAIALWPEVQDLFRKLE